jgi:hypothetical protein
MLKMNSITTVGNRNKYGANREPHRVRWGGVNNDPPSAGDIVFGALIGRYHCNTPPLHLIGTRWSSTACPTKPKFYIAIRSGLSRKRGALHQNHVGEVGSTSTIGISFTHLLVFAIQLRGSNITQIDHSFLR